MKILELYFNPEKKTVKISQDDPQRKNIDILFVIGEVSEPGKENKIFLEKVFNLIKRGFNKKNTEGELQKTLEEVLEKANETISKGGYKGELSAAILCLKKDNFHFSKIGKIKIVKIKNKNSEDLDEAFYTHEPKLFQKVISGKIKKEERLFIFTSEINKFFTEKDFLKKIKEGNLNNLFIKEVSALVNEKFPDKSGAAVIISNQKINKKKKNIVSEREYIFQFKSIVPEFLKSVSEKVKKLELTRLKKISNKIKIKKKYYIPVLFAFLLLFSWFSIETIQENRILKKYEKEATNLQEKFLTAKEDDSLKKMEEFFFEVEEIKEKEEVDSKDINEKYESMKKDLKAAYKGEDVVEMELIGTADKIDPEGIAIANNNIYLFSFKESEVEVLNSEEKYTLENNNKPKMVSAGEDEVFLFSPPSTLNIIKNEVVSSTLLSLPKSGSSFISMTSFLGTPYFLDSDGSIFKYENKAPTTWIKDDNKVSGKVSSMAIDGSIFVLKNDDEIDRYYKGEKKESINFSIFPRLSNNNKIYTFHNTPIFITDLSEKRIILIDKDGDLIKQLFIEDLNNLKDIAVSGQGKKIYLLTEKQVYLINNEI